MRARIEGRPATSAATGRGVEGGGFAGLRGGQLDPRGQLQPLNPLNPAAADVAPGVSGVEGAG